MCRHTSGQVPLQMSEPTNQPISKFTPCECLESVCVTGQLEGIHAVMGRTSKLHKAMACPGTQVSL